MTAKEKREMQRLRIRIEELERSNQRHMEVWRENNEELIDMRSALREAHDALVDAVFSLNRVIRDHDRIEPRLLVGPERG